MHRLLALLLVLVAPLALGACGQSVEDARAVAATVNGLCPVREEPVEPNAYLVHEGQRIGFCCPPCKGEFRRDPESFLKKMRADRSRFAYVGN